MLDLLKLRLRRQFFDSYGQRAREQQAKLAPRGIRFSCPACGYPTLDCRAQYDMCELCWWEDDGQDDDTADEVWGGPNHDYSLTDARENFQEYLVMYPPERDKRIGGPDSEQVRRIKRNLMDVFEKMIEEPIPRELDQFWEHARLLEQELDREEDLR